MAEFWNPTGSPGSWSPRSPSRCWPCGPGPPLHVKRMPSSLAHRRAVSDLAPMFLLASGIRAPLGTGLALHGSFTGQLIGGALLAPAVSNLPAAAAIVAAGTPGLWAAVLATTVGPGLLVTGSVACHRRRSAVGLHRSTASA
jgi:hypothetical protein